MRGLGRADRPAEPFNLFLVFRPDCDLLARASALLSRPACSTAGSLEKSIKSADLANRSGRVKHCEEHKNGAPTEVIVGEGNGLASTRPILTELTMSLGFLCSMGFGTREVCYGVWEGVLDDMHGLDFFSWEI